MFRFYLFILSLFSVCVFANTKPTLTVYSYSSLGPAKKIKADFEKQCDCNLDIVKIDDGAMILNRLRLEGKNTKADVILGLDSSMIDIAKKHQLAQSHNIKKHQNLDIDWWDNDFVPYDYGTFAFIYDKQKIKNPPKSFDELLSNKNNWKIVYQDPRTSTPGLGLMLWINHVYKNDAKKAWQKLAKKTLTVTKGWSESYGLFLKGEADFVLSYNSSPAYHIMYENERRYAAALFKEGHYSQIEVAGISKYSKQKKLAKAFLNFLLTDDIQQAFASDNMMYPAVKVALPKAFDELEVVKKAYQFSSKDVQKNQSKWIKAWQQSVSQ